MSGRGNSDTAGTNEMIHLRHVEKWTLQQIADKFGISRERVRQRIGNTGNLAMYQKQIERKSVFDKFVHSSNSKIAKVLGMSVRRITNFRSKNGNGERHEMEGGWAKVGYEVENYVSRLLIDNGIPHKFTPPNHAFDILLDNGLRVDVKSSTERTYLTRWTPLYSFELGQKRRGRYADFFILFIRETKDVFVVPASETRISSPVRFCFPEPDHGRKSKWLQYHNRFDLLK